MTLTPEEGRKLHVLTLLEGKRISLSQAAEALGVTPRQVRRLRVGQRREGPAVGPIRQVLDGRGIAEGTARGDAAHVVGPARELCGDDEEVGAGDETRADRDGRDGHGVSAAACATGR